MKISPHFTLDEAVFSQTAARMGSPLGKPPPDVMDNIERLAHEVLEPLRGILGKPIKITSWWRPVWLNKAIGGAPNSQHIVGEAADIVVPDFTPADVWRAAVQNGLQVRYDQIIHEFDRWVHISVGIGRKREPFQPTRRTARPCIPMGW